MTKKAALVFNEIPKDERPEAAYVFDDDFEGIIKYTLPSFWSEELSHIYTHFDLAAIQQQAEKRNELQRVGVQETKLLNEASLEKEIMELRRRGHSIEKIARSLSCNTWQVRKIGFNEAGIDIYHDAICPEIKSVVESLIADNLPILSADQTCNGGGCHQ
jgi:hypothetical protein